MTVTAVAATPANQSRMQSKERGSLLAQARPEAQLIRPKPKAVPMKTARPANPKSTGMDLPPRELFHTWDDDQSVASEVPPIPEVQKMVRIVQLQGLQQMMDSDSDDDQANAAGGDDSETEDVTPASGKTLLPMLSEEEIAAKEEAFRALLSKARDTLRGAAAALFEEAPLPAPAPYVLPVSPKGKAKGSNQRADGLALALDQLQLQQQQQQVAVVTEVEVETVKTSRIQQMADDDHSAAKPKAARRAPKTQSGPAPDLDLQDYMITKSKGVRAFDWTQSAPEEVQDVAEVEQEVVIAAAAAPIAFLSPAVVEVAVAAVAVPVPARSAQARALSASALRPTVSGELRTFVVPLAAKARISAAAGASVPQDEHLLRLGCLRREVSSQSLQA